MEWECDHDGWGQQMQGDPLLEETKGPAIGWWQKVEAGRQEAHPWPHNAPGGATWDETW